MVVTSIVQASQEKGGILSVEDFSRYRVRQEQPLQCDYRGYEVVTAPPPGGGVSAIREYDSYWGRSFSADEWVRYQYPPESSIASIHAKHLVLQFGKRYTFGNG